MKDKIQRFGAVVGVKPDSVLCCEALHSAIRLGVLALLKQCSIQNDSILIHEKPEP